MSSSFGLPPHAPEPSRVRRLLGDYHVTGLFWYRALRWAVVALPSWLLAPLVAVFTGMFFLVIFKIRRAVASNLVPVLGPCHFLKRQCRIFATLHAFAWCLSERYERLLTSRAFDVQVEAIEHWQAVVASGRGFVMVTAHLGLYEVGSMIPATQGMRRVHLVREPEVDPRAQAFMREAVAGVQDARYTMHFQDDDPSLGIALLEALGRGEVVAVQGDRPRTGSRTVTTTLFGRPFLAPAGPAALARTAEVPILPVFAMREGRRRFRMVFRPPIAVARTRDRDADLVQATHRIVGEIQDAIRRTPHQWFVFRELWPDQTMRSSVR